jgi:uncharacterized protein (DUF3820 family)
MENNKAVYQLFMDFQKTYDSVRREALYNILIEFGIPMNLLRLIKMCLNKTYGRVRVGRHLADMFPTSYLEWFETRRCSIAIAFKLCCRICIRRFHLNDDGLKVNGTHQLLVYANDVNILGGSVHVR